MLALAACGVCRNPRQIRPRRPAAWLVRPPQTKSLLRASYESSINKPPASIDPPTYLTFPALLQCVLLLSVFHHAAEIPPSGLFSLPWYSVSINFQGLFQPSPIPAKDDAIGILLSSVHMQLLPFRFYLFTADPRRSACLSVCLSINDLENHDGQAQYKLAPQLSISTHRRMKVAVDLEIRGSIIDVPKIQMTPESRDAPTGPLPIRLVSA